ncbi:MAG TPA: pentapeptide repeat-containing protein [Candidatus Saccharimonadales bacterium]|nr:pentapeptide repeat-containing protein [Candidatus Saccharimonadales bacterium]
MKPDHTIETEREKLQPAVQSETLYSQIKTKLENKRWVAVILLGSVVTGGVVAFLKNVKDLGELLRGSDNDIEVAAKNIGDSSPEVRIIGVKKIVEIGGQNKDRAEKTIAVLTAFLHGKAKIGADETRRPQEHADVQEAVRSLGKILETSDKNNWSVKRPRLEGLDFSGLDLSHLYLRAVVIVDSYFDKALLDYADFSQAEMLNVRFDGARALGIKLNGAQIKSSCLEEVDFTSAELRSLLTWSTDLNSASLEGSYLSGARLQNTRLANANFNRADLSSVDFSEALEIVTGQFDKAVNTQSAKMPDPLYRRSTLSVCGPRR